MVIGKQVAGAAVCGAAFAHALGVWMAITAGPAVHVGMSWTGYGDFRLPLP